MIELLPAKNQTFVLNFISENPEKWDRFSSMEDCYLDYLTRRIISPVSLDNLFLLEDFFKEKFVCPPALYGDLTYKIGLQKKLSFKTVQAYSGYIKNFFTFTNKRSRDITTDDLNSFLVHVVTEKNPASSTIHLMISALHFFFRSVTSQFPDLVLERPKKERQLPEILTKEEVMKIIRCTENPKHKALLSLVYSSGLRVSEVVKLRLEDIDRDRSLLKVSSPKGKLERTTILSKLGISQVDEYLELAGNPLHLFPGQNTIRPISIRSAEKIFESAKNKAGIRKKVSIHSLRHAFATHLLESGTNIKYVQSLLGHKNLQTTQIYRLVTSEKNVQKKETATIIPLERIEKAV